MAKARKHVAVDAKSRIKMDLANKTISYEERIKIIDDYFYASFMKWFRLTNADKQFMLWMLSKRKELKKEMKAYKKSKKNK